MTQHAGDKRCDLSAPPLWCDSWGKRWSGIAVACIASHMEMHEPSCQMTFPSLQDHTPIDSQKRGTMSRYLRRNLHMSYVTYVERSKVDIE